MAAFLEEYRRLEPFAFEAQDRLLRDYAGDRNVVGAGYGQRTKDSSDTYVPAVEIYVLTKRPADLLRGTTMLPARVVVHGETVEIDVIQTGPIYPHLYTARERPAPAGISVSHVSAAGSGTFGCVVLDKVTGAQFMLSNNHVLANENQAQRGDIIVQPGWSDGGQPRPQIGHSTDDSIGDLERFIPLGFGSTPNKVDCAVANVSVGTLGGQVVDDIKGPMDRPNPYQAAVGLLFAGANDGSRTFFNPMPAVVAQLGIKFPAGVGSADDPPILSNVQKTGRTTEYTTGRVRAKNVAVNVTYTHGTGKFTGQIATSPMSLPGDSGSVLCYGGSGVEEAPSPQPAPPPGSPSTPCDSVIAGENLTGVPLTTEWAAIKTARDRYLAATRIGRYAIALFYSNEERLIHRANETTVAPDARALAQALYSKYSAEAKLAMIDPDRDDVRVTHQHLEDARVGLMASRPYLQDDELAALEKLLVLGERTVGRNGREVLEMLDNAGIYQEVMAIAQRVRFLDTSVADGIGG